MQTVHAMKICVNIAREETEIPMHACKIVGIDHIHYTLAILAHTGLCHINQDLSDVFVSLAL